MDRLIEIRITNAQDRSSDEADTLAVQLFRNTADSAGMIVQGPIYAPRKEVHYTARYPGERPINGTTLNVRIGNHTSFLIRNWGTEKDFEPGERAASLFKNKLDNMNIPYAVRREKSIIPP